MNITKDDLKLIILQCEHQQDTTPEAVAGFTAAYIDAKDLHLSELLNLGDVLAKVKEWGKLIKSKENHYGFRNVPVMIGVSATPDPGVVPRMMENYCEEYWWYVVRQPDRSNLHWKGADQLYKQFEEIHPFLDGNGRVGHLLWAIAKQELEGEWPMTLPPDMWSSE